MSNLLKERQKAFSIVHQKFSCEHENKEIRLRTIRGGSIQRVEQCLKCGRAVSNAYSKEKVLELTGKENIPEFDSELMENWEKSYAEECKSIMEGYESRKDFERAEFFQEYDKYLLSEEWAKKREKVLNRANGICEGCGENNANQVHHLTYKNVGAEFLFELVAICHECHDRLHEQK
mgnify:CR=1 FL=1